jgi:hypothetical protein
VLWLSCLFTVLDVFCCFTVSCLVLFCLVLSCVLFVDFLWLSCDRLAIVLVYTSWGMWYLRAPFVAAPIAIQRMWRLPATMGSLRICAKLGYWGVVIVLILSCLSLDSILSLFTLDCSLSCRRLALAMSLSREDQTAAVAMRLVDRRDFVASNPYEDCAVPIGFNVVISAPHVHAIGLFCSTLNPNPWPLP